MSANGIRKRLLVIGEAASPSGFSRVLDNICEELADTFEIVRLGANYRGSAVEGRWRLEPHRVPGDMWGRVSAAALAQQHDPDIVLVYADPQFLSVQTRLFAGSRARVVLYCSIDFPTLSADRAGTLCHVDDIVLYTDHAKRTMLAALGESGPSPRLTVIPPGIDAGDFHPLPGANARASARERLFPDRPELRDAFLVLNANRNSQRKHVDLTLQGFARFARRREDAYLYLHMGLRNQVGDLRSLSRSLGIEKRILATTWSDDHPDISDERLNLIYNACELGVNTSSGEGFGLVAFEHARTGAAQVMPAHASLQSLWADAATFVGVTECHGGGIVDPADLACALERLARDRGLLARRSADAYNLATRPDWNWAEAGRRWRALLTS